MRSDQTVDIKVISELNRRLLTSFASFSSHTSSQVWVGDCEAFLLLLVRRAMSLHLIMLYLNATQDANAVRGQGQPVQATSRTAASYGEV